MERLVPSAMNISFRLTGPPEAEHPRTPGLAPRSIERSSDAIPLSEAAGRRPVRRPHDRARCLLVPTPTVAAGTPRTPMAPARRQTHPSSTSPPTARLARPTARFPAFVSQWKEDHDDQNVIFQESYAGSTTQAANVIDRLRSRHRGALARARRAADRRRRLDLRRLAGRARQGHGLDLGRGLRRPSRQPERSTRTGTTSPPTAPRS